MENPYKVLGISQQASDSEVKKAYRELAKKYHPDNYINSPLSDIASEKMKQINEAYATITKERESGSLNKETGKEQAVRSETEIRARYLITEGRISEAEVVLNRVAKEARTAEWNYLMGVLCLRKGMLFESISYAEVAVKMDNSNKEYIAFLDSVSKNSKKHQGASHSERGICGAFPCGKICGL